VKKFKQILETKLPKTEQGRAIDKYLRIVLTNLKWKFGKDFLILTKFNKDIVDIDKKNETITELIPMIGVRAIRHTNKTIEPIM